jgi:F0F1-type ATP synthase membrane subunit b/b'
MPQTRTATSDFSRAFGDAKKQANDIAGDAADTAQDIYDHARDGAADFANNARRAARKSAGSFEKALRNAVETQPYSAVVFALGLGWLLGRMHRPL